MAMNDCEGSRGSSRSGSRQGKMGISEIRKGMDMPGIYREGSLRAAVSFRRRKEAHGSIGLVDISGNTVISYSYGSWGRILLL